MIVHDFDLFGAAVAPDEAHPPLVIDADTVLASATSFQQLETIPWRRCQIGELLRLMYLAQLALCDPLDVRSQPPRNLHVRARPRLLSSARV